MDVNHCWEPFSQHTQVFWKINSQTTIVIYVLILCVLVERFSDCMTSHPCVSSS